MMGASFKGFGKGFAEILLNSTSNSFVGLFIGILATSLVQSSSTTTSIVVGMVASGVLSISSAVPIIMGANIGTTVTNTLVSLGHVTRREEFKRAISGATVHDFFNIICVAIMFPLELATGFLQKSATYLTELFILFGGIKFTSPIKVLTQPVVDMVKHFLTDSAGFDLKVTYILLLVLSAVLLFMSLYFIVKVMRSLMMERVEAVLHNALGKNEYLSILVGLVVTVIVQSSSITTSLLIPLMGAGILSLRAAFPITMGANIGTTTTAILASLATGNPAAITIAFVHFLFNFIGVAFIYPIKVIREIPISLALKLGELAADKRRYAFIYVLTLFFILPTTLIIIARLFN
jgi:sodium-dependent phosphate cotransporter